MGDDRAREVGLNEALFREVNERIEGLTQDLGLAAEPMAIVCECADTHCTQQLTVDVATYERVRSDAGLFLVAPGHVASGLEYVVERHEGYEVVRKREGEPAETARETDPRR